MENRIKTFKNDEEFAELFHYITEKERLCLVDLKKELDEKINKEHKKAIDLWQKNRDEYVKANPGDKLFVDRLTRAVGADDSAAFTALESEIKVDLDPAGKPTTLATKRAALFAFARPAAKGQAGTEAQEKLAFFINMDVGTWRGRNLLYLEREIDQMTIFALRRPQLTARQNEQVNNFISTLQRQRAVTIGALGLYDRSITLSRFIENVREKSVEGGTAPATSEYATARTELDVVLAQIEAHRTRVLAAAKPAPPPQASPLKLTNMKRVLPKVIDDSKAPGWITTEEGANALDYVLVLKEVQ